MAERKLDGCMEILPQNEGLTDRGGMTRLITMTSWPSLSTQSKVARRTRQLALVCGPRCDMSQFCSRVRKYGPAIQGPLHQAQLARPLCMGNPARGDLCTWPVRFQLHLFSLLFPHQSLQPTQERKLTKWINEARPDWPFLQRRGIEAMRKRKTKKKISAKAPQTHMYVRTSTHMRDDKIMPLIPFIKS